MYKQWLVPAYLENPADFPKASTCLQLSVTNHATAHTLNVRHKARKIVLKLNISLNFVNLWNEKKTADIF